MVELDVQINQRSAAEVAAGLGLVAGPALLRALRDGLAPALEIGASSVWKTATAKGMKQITGTLASAIRGRLVEGDAAAGMIGVPENVPGSAQAWLLGNEQKTIVPIKARALTVPYAANLTGAGKARYASYAALVAAFGANNVFTRYGAFGGAFGAIGAWTEGRKSKKTGVGKAAVKWFFLLFGKTQPKPVNALVPGVEAAAAEMTARVQQSVDALVEKAREKMA